DGLAAHDVEQRLDMCRVVRPGIDDRDLTATDDVADRALERERARIVGQDAANAGRDLFGASWRQVEILVERNVVGDAGLFGKTRADASLGRLYLLGLRSGDLVTVEPGAQGRYAPQAPRGCRGQIKGLRIIAAPKGELGRQPSLGQRKFLNHLAARIE